MLSQLDSFFDVPRDQSTISRDIRAANDVNAAIYESLSDNNGRIIETFSDGYEGKSGVVKSNSFFEAEIFGDLFVCVFSSMLSGSQYFKILYSVIFSFVVFVVHMLIGFEFSSEMVFHHLSMGEFSADVGVASHAGTPG